jgi:hypothetical protein
MADLTPIAVWETLQAGKVPREYLQKVPEELRGMAEKYRRILEGQFALVKQYIEDQAQPILFRYGNDRRALGQFVQEHPNRLGMIRSALFLMLDGKTGKLDELYKKLIYPRGNQFVDEAVLFD